MRFTRAVFPETQRLLQRLYRQSRHHQVRQRAHCILLSSQNYSIAQLMDDRTSHNVVSLSGWRCSFQG